MATGPINYGAMMADPFDGLGQYLQMGQQIQQIRAQRAQAENAQLAAQQYQADVGAAFAAPTPQAFAALAVKYPQHREAFKQGWDGLNAERQQSELGDVSTLAAALQSGRADLAMQKLDARIKTMGEAGADTSKFELLKGEIERDPKKAYGTALSVLAGIPGGDKVLENLGKIGTERRAESLFPAEQRTKEAGATEAEAKAVTATAEAGIADKRAKLTIDQLGANLKLTDAQIKQANAAASASNAAANRDRAPPALTPSQAFEAEGKLRKEYSDQTKNYAEVAESYKRVKAADATGAGDLALVYGYMKMLDPASVVREGEFATAENSSGVEDRIRNIYNKVKNGERLTEGQRKVFKAQAAKFHDTALEKEQAVRKTLAPIARGYGLNVDNIFYGNAPAKEAEQPAPAPASSEPTAVNPKTGERVVLRGGKWVPL